MFNARMIHDFYNLALMELESVYRLAAAMTLDGAAAEELVAEVYRQAERPSPMLRERDIRVWLMRLLVQTYAGQLIAASDASATVKCPQTAPPKAVAQPFAPVREIGWIQAALAPMSFRCRAVTVLWAVEALNSREIAEIMDEPVGTVSLWLSRARNHLLKKRQEASA